MTEKTIRTCIAALEDFKYRNTSVDQSDIEDALAELDKPDEAEKMALENYLRGQDIGKQKDAAILDSINANIRANEAEAHADALAEALEVMLRAEVDYMLTNHLGNPNDVWRIRRGQKVLVDYRAGKNCEFTEVAVGEYQPVNKSAPKTVPLGMLTEFSMGGWTVVELKRIAARYGYEVTP